MKNLVAVLFALLSLNALSQIPDYVPTDGLVAWYEMDGGTLDSSPNENHGIPTGVSAYTDRNGIESGALWFDGINDYITVPFSESIDIQAEFSSAVWVYLQGGGCNPRVYEIHEYLNCGGYTLAFNEAPGDLPRTFHTSNFGGCQSSLAAHSGGSASVQPGEWHHIALTFTPGPTSSGKLYVDGILVNEAFLSQDISGINYYGAPLYIGNLTPDRCDWYGGGMDELGFWEKTLSPEEIWSVYVGAPLNPGCTDEMACNFNEDANSNDGSCIPSGCMEPGACNYNEAAECGGEACDYTCCPGPGCCSEGMYWDWDSLACYISKPADINLDGCVQLNDLLDLLSAYGDCIILDETETVLSDSVLHNGQWYGLVTIGNQVWFAENLNTAEYNNGDAIDGVCGQEEWFNGQMASQNVYGDCGLTVYDGVSDLEENEAIYGRLYNVWAVSDERGICPSGYRVSTNDDWSYIIEVLGGEDEAAAKMRTTGIWEENTGLWETSCSNFECFPNNSTNDSGLAIQPGGFRGYNGWLYAGQRRAGIFMTGTLAGPAQPIIRRLDSSPVITQSIVNQYWGASVRCVADAE